jgi:hypothetical protein
MECPLLRLARMKKRGKHHGFPAGPKHSAVSEKVVAPLVPRSFASLSYAAERFICVA